MKQTISPQELKGIISSTIGSRVKEKIDIKRTAEICTELYKDEQQAVNAYKKKIIELKKEAESISERGNVAVYVPSRICVQPVYIHLPEWNNWLMMSYVPLGMAGVHFGEAGLRSPNEVFKEWTHRLFEEDESGNIRLNDTLYEEIPRMARLDGMPWEEWRERILRGGNIGHYESFVLDSIMDEKTLNDRQASFFQVLYGQAEKYEGLPAVGFFDNEGTTSIKGIDLSRREQYVRNVLIPTQLAFQRLQDCLFDRVIERDEGFKIHFLDKSVETNPNRDIGGVYRQHKESIEADLASLDL